MDSDEESAQGSPTSNSPSSPHENASNSDGSDSSDSESNASGADENPKTPNSPDAASRDNSSSHSSNDSSNESFKLRSPEAPGEASRDVSQDVSQDAHEEPQQKDSPAERVPEEPADEWDEEVPETKETNEEKDLQNEEKKGFDLAHEDLSEISDVDSGSSLSGNNMPQSPAERDDNENNEAVKITDLREKLNARKKAEDGQKVGHQEDFVATNGGTKFSEEKRNDEDALDFEAEDGECADDGKEVVAAKKEEEDGEAKANEAEEELEEGEVTDDDDRRPEETEPKPVCRFYARGQCTWGVSCRFLHPGVTDKGNYTMFDMVRPIAGGQPGGFDYRDRPKAHIPSSHHAPALGMGLPTMLTRPSPLLDAPGGGESPWERGLRTAKEMLRKANKRKEQDLDFEDKKMNLSAGQEDIDRDYYSMDKAVSPELSPPPYARVDRFSPPPAGAAAKFVPRKQHYMEEDAFGRTQRYRELPPHRMPQYEDERRVRPVREVIVQRSEPVRDDEWSDPWMRSKSPAGRERDKLRGERSTRDRSWSSKSYSSSSSSQSDSSSDSSRSKSPLVYRKRDKKGRSSRGSKGRDSQKIYSHSSAEKRYSYGRQSDGRAHSPIVASNKRALERISASQHQLKRRKISPPPKDTRKFDRKPPRRSRSSSSASSDSSGSESESSASSSSDDSSRSGRKKPANHRATEATTARHKTTAERPAKQVDNKESNTSAVTASSAKKTTRREELLKQLKAVEDAIARKRSKISS
ncbi:zinc finger CCCH domain-containing protein 18 isoform X2 [Phlebotomus papatasi]|uniref:zinc finger CCCH domain-containing protein 18 isoform X2 n=1 Tax=Phlebotomus papatasi TaxID=29031 RepID=UPI0024845CDE|nr:zinc finger CCCH domain-containing protein 18 isoform X2 [Phlebotomus papatasi]XP_055704853.1 zinc finger CCCH domain-containing protein 18 isoform X2 [Phlebotomus papatasi]XP_055704854.1 zinc finger CCCH domain-containing protein 18 isoform X2 [Phlebotomus papatasi]